MQFIYIFAFSLIFVEWPRELLSDEGDGDAAGVVGLLLGGDRSRVLQLSDMQHQIQVRWRVRGGVRVRVGIVNKGTKRILSSLKLRGSGSGS